MGEGSAFFADAPSGFLAWCGFAAGLAGGGIGWGGGGGCRMSIVVSRSTACRTISTLSPDRMMKARAA
jgi:hypothetical protein